jgi:excisionase family DNA binding protein
VTRDELAEMMGVSVDTIDRWRHQGMPSVVFGRRSRRFQPSRCVAWASVWKGVAA